MNVELAPNNAFVPLSALGGRRAAAPAPALDVEAELAAFERAERVRLGLPADDTRAHYVERIYGDPRTADKATTTIMVSGLTLAQDEFVAAALSGLGFRVVPLEVPDDEALRYGKEFGSRGQCNPTWFTVGNLVKTLVHMRDRQGLATEEIIARYVFLTSGSCGPCRFGMYTTEYRKALRDAGFDGFRVLLFQMNGGIKQASGDDAEGPKGLAFDPKFFWAIANALLIGDALNVLGYRLRPYEVEAGATDEALTRAKRHITAAFTERKSVLVALWRARRELAQVRVDRTRPKPKAALIGEFWAMTTEGAGSYGMQRFFEREGAETDIQTVTQWIAYMVWEALRDTRHRETLRQDDQARKGLAGKNPWKKKVMLHAADKVLRGLFQGLANTMGLHGYRINDIQQYADVSEAFYNHDVRGGEAFLEVGKLIVNAAKQKTNMTVSIKPFGCMPSSGVSDGIQSAITELYPEAIFLPIETTGDGAVNVQSRVQMMLFKARQAAEGELQQALDAYGMTREEFAHGAERFAFVNHPLFHPPHRFASTAANTAELVGALTHPLKGLERYWKHAREKTVFRTHRQAAN